MTTELEKQFFDTFGIEPKYESHSCDGWGRTIEVKYFADKKEADKFGMVLSEAKYPEITDRILLKLILIMNPYAPPVGDTMEEMKMQVLYWCIQYANKLKHQVQKLFKGE